MVQPNQNYEVALFYDTTVFDCSSYRILLANL